MTAYETASKMIDAVEVLTEHYWAARGMTAASADRCACGEKTYPLPGEEDATERRARAFAVHQANMLFPLLRAAS